jgi:hypothetical protein
MECIIYQASQAPSSQRSLLKEVGDYHLSITQSAPDAAHAHLIKIDGDCLIEIHASQVHNKQNSVKCMKLETRQRWE